MRHDQPAVPASTWYTCDRCKKDQIDVDAKIELMSRDFQGGVVGSQMAHLCESCRSDFAAWLVAGKEA